MRKTFGEDGTLTLTSPSLADPRDAMRVPE
jgi:hypothetical protein